MRPYCHSPYSILHSSYGHSPILHSSYCHSPYLMLSFPHTQYFIPHTSCCHSPILNTLFPIPHAVIPPHSIPHTSFPKPHAVIPPFPCSQVNLKTLDLANNRITRLQNVSHLLKLEDFWVTNDLLPQPLNLTPFLYPPLPPHTHTLTHTFSFLVSSTIIN